jgi:ferrous iron transport protein A
MRVTHRSNEENVMKIAMDEHTLLPLGLLAVGDSAEVMQPAVRGMHVGLMRLEEMGLRPGARVEVLANEGFGPLLLKVGEARIAIGRGIAMQLRVRPVEAHGGGCRS